MPLDSMSVRILYKTLPIIKPSSSNPEGIDMNSSVRNTVLVLLLSFGATLSAFAQGNAQFQGRVTDPQQRVVAKLGARGFHDYL